MANKSHLKFLSEKQLSEIKDFKYNYGFGPNEEDNTPKNYYRLANSFKADLANLNTDLEEKYRIKDRTIEIPYDIDYIQITFQDQFVISKYFQDYYSDFGLEAVAFYDFAQKGLFAVADRDKFEVFLTNVNNFIEFGLKENQESTYSNYVIYIRSFKLLRTNDILKFQIENIGSIIYLSLINLPLDEEVKQQIVQSLITYVETNNIEYKYDTESDRIELHNPSVEQIQKIIQNFDIIESVTCSAFTTIRPTQFNTVQREFGFVIENAEEELPIVGIIDTGISQQTALAPLIINDTTFTLAGNPLIDQAGRNRLGHGTAVAGLVALGKDNHRNNFEGEVVADAKLLSIKISDNGCGYISEINLLKMLYDVKAKYPHIRLFTLTTCYGNHMNTNESFSDYTFSLDSFAYETDSLIFICTGNNDNCINENTNYDLSYFNHEHTNLSTPADSQNNIIIGAAADNLKNGAFRGIANGREFPTLYTRKGHVDLSTIYNAKKTNKNYFKPDVINSGGDMGFYNANTLDWMDEPALTLLSARPEIGIMEEVGTSFSTPLVANLAAKIIKNYPTLSNESIKALIINGASLELIPFPTTLAKLKNRVAGNGLVNDFKSLYSTDNSATLILEDTIQDGKIRIYPINFPNYLVQDDLGKKNGILKISATLCFKFKPIKNNQLSYNPIHIAFCIFKNQSAEDIMKPDEELKSKLKSTLSWSENGRYVSKPLPYSNTQKISFNVNVSDLINEKNSFKLAIHTKLSEQIVGGLPENYPTEFPFSIVLTIEETVKSNTGKLYDEIQLVNNLEAIQGIDLDAGLEADALNV
ncbi:S8 family serine peptidase [Dysgonomonas termitidis]|uniref:S8 family serine peptidase n=1 Tax=Dysgonomonas termitidis TaxID=1516126 RepID=A0ABV9L2N3_9BACT